MGEIGLRDFDERLNSGECGQELRTTMATLRAAAERCGPVVWRAHETPGGGWGLTGKRDGRVFCHFDPKPSTPKVCVCIPGATVDELRSLGSPHLRKNAPPWVDILGADSASKIEPLMQRAYSAAGLVTTRPLPDRRHQAHDVPSDPAVAKPESTGGCGSNAPAASGDQSTPVRTDLEGRGFRFAGAIRPKNGGRACWLDMSSMTFRGTVVYAVVVGEQLMKCGDTGRKGATLLSRMSGYVHALNQILSGRLVGPFSEHFKARAPRAIEANLNVEVWAMQASTADCSRLQRELNHKHDTVRAGWANRLE